VDRNRQDACSMSKHITHVLPVLALLAFGGPALGLDEKACKLEAASLPAAFAQCATLSVPEDYSNPNGRRLDLFVARIPALTATPRADPLTLINGGPGGSSVDLYLQMRAAFEPARRDRDIILLDQRGTGRSADGLTCTVPDGLELETAGVEELGVIVEGCLSDFSRDPRFYSTSVAVQDLDGLRRELGIAEWNVYGISYGTRVAQHYLRRFPDTVRAIILDGVVPAELVLGPDIASNAQAALDAIFSRCEKDAACSDRFADLDEKFDTVRRRLASEPISFGGNDPLTGEAEDIVFAEEHLQAVIRLMSYAAPTVSLLPLVIDDAYDGNYQPLAAQAEIVIQGIAETLGFAMHNSVVCTEDAPFFPDAAGAEASDAYLGTVIVDALTAICSVWPAGVLDEDFKSPVQSDRPVLLLSGEYDPVTPPAYAERVIAGGLSNSRHLVGPGQGHGLAAVGCMPRLMRSFLDSADPQNLETECLAEEPPTPFFLSFQGPAP